MIFRYHCYAVWHRHNFKGYQLCNKYFLQNCLTIINNKTKRILSYGINEKDEMRREGENEDKKDLEISLYLSKRTVINSKEKSLNNIYPYYKSNYYINKNNVFVDMESLFCNDKKFFSGRSVGLKRKKKRKDERVINTCLGKRLEFFYPKKKRRQRIGLIQNSRKNIVYDNILKRFLVYYYKQGIQVFRSFSCKKKRKFESARNKAIILSKQFQKKYTKQKEKEEKSNKTPLSIHNCSNLMTKYDHDVRKQIKIVPDKNKSGYRGVFYDSAHHAYICTYNEAGIRKFQIFKIENNDYLEAYNLAVMCRRYKLFKNFQFVSQRNRVRSGRIHLK
ncbi:transcription factor with AP2 domain(s), putative [Plasmodium malariae]|uniref:Transcription factor with AP2 domain(S), putative n=1 Tax=Plasmodium malariae TaxID=5858 RepID=A0A1D3TE62_PLAMA|nr:transcription factor with AP2 domain(s), putative [Plasmodium malariae]SCP03165.1 transcription factor with AP2 domain(s), putative [Plasmodium malariae]